jgi:hypothetical protein
MHGGQFAREHKQLKFSSDAYKLSEGGLQMVFFLQLQATKLVKLIVYYSNVIHQINMTLIKFDQS